VRAKSTGLPPRLRRICILIARGYTNKDIAHETRLTYDTVKVYVSHLVEAMGMVGQPGNTRVKITHYALAHRLISLDDVYPAAENQIEELLAYSLLDGGE
jgi:DNA-binding NarL/FixJ family response regulator